MARKLKIYAYYYPWYTGPEDEKWQPCKEYAPLMGMYDSSDPAVIRQHIEWAIEYGIDGFLIENFGKEARYHYAPMNENLALFREIVREYPGFEFCVFYDQEIAFGSIQNLRFEDSKNWNRFIGDFQYIAQENFNHPNHMKVKGRPVVVIYLTRTASNSYAEVLDAARQAAAAKGFGTPYLIGDEVWWREKNAYFQNLEGVTAYSLQNRKELVAINSGVKDYCQHVAELYQRIQPDAISRGADVFPHIGHAYNDIAIRNNLPLVPTVVEGELPQYKEDIIECMKSMRIVWQDSPLFHSTGNAYLFINSFNEWMERSVIEPTLEINTVNKLFDFPRDEYIYLQPHRFEYLEGIKEGKSFIEKKVLPLL